MTPFSRRKSIALIHGAASGQPTPHDNRYVVAWNPHTRFGTLAVTSTADPAQAHRFSVAEALADWNTVSRIEPRRPRDGKPNRPLSALTVELVKATDV